MSVRALPVFGLVNSFQKYFVKKMEKDGLVTRRRSDEDERVTLIRITDQGMALREAAAEIPSQVGGCLKLPAEDALNLYHTMYKLLGEFS